MSGAASKSHPASGFLCKAVRIVRPEGDHEEVVFVAGHVAGGNYVWQFGLRNGCETCRWTRPDSRFPPLESDAVCADAGFDRSTSARRSPMVGQQSKQSPSQCRHVITCTCSCVVGRSAVTLAFSPRS